MRFPDANIGYHFGYESRITDDAILVTFLWRLVRIRLPFDRLASADRATYRGGRISWDVIRWGRCPPGGEAVAVLLRRGPFLRHLIVFDDNEAAIAGLRAGGVASGAAPGRRSVAPEPGPAAGPRA